MVPAAERPDLGDCPECGTRIPDLALFSLGMKWSPSPGCCGTCHAAPDQWPVNNTKKKYEDAFASGDVSDWVKDSMSGRNDGQLFATPHPRCGHACKRLLRPSDAGCCDYSGASNPCSDCFRKVCVKSQHYNSGPAAAAAPNVVLTDVMGARVEVSLKADRDRTKRLRNGPVRILFHQTNAVSANSIICSGKILRGQGGAMDGGCYFAETVDAMDR